MNSSASGHSVEAGPLVTYQKYNVINNFVHEMTVKDKRRVFNIMRTGDGDENTFLPRYGLTVGEFSVFYTLQENTRKK